NELAIISGLPKYISGNTKYVRGVVALCGSFLTVRWDFVYVIHQSVKDYLSKKASSAIFPDGPREAHYALFSRSILALSNGLLRRNIYNLSHPGVLIDDVDRPDPDPLAAIRYSCVHWIDHLWEEYTSRSDTR